MKRLNNQLLGDYQFIKQIGLGTYGLVYLVRDLKTNSLFAAKFILHEPILDKHATKQFIENSYDCHNVSVCSFDDFNKSGEIALHLKVHHHPNVASIHAIYSTPFAYIVIMDYYPQGDLFKNITQNNIFNNNPVLMKSVILQLINTIQFCHKNNVFHCDLKPENIMIEILPNPISSNNCYNSNDNYYNSPTIQIYLIDFGLSMNSSLLNSNSSRGSSFYMAPERVTNFTTDNYIKSIINLSDYHYNFDKNTYYFPTDKGDIWSLGILLINITCGKNPWPQALILDQSSVFYDYMINHNHSVLGQILPISSQFNSILNSIFKLNPCQRINLQDLYVNILHTDFFNVFNSPPTSDDEDFNEIFDNQSNLSGNYNNQSNFSGNYNQSDFNNYENQFANRFDNKSDFYFDQIATTTDDFVKNQNIQLFSKSDYCIT